MQGNIRFLDLGYCIRASALHGSSLVEPCGDSSLGAVDHLAHGAFQERDRDILSQLTSVFQAGTSKVHMLSIRVCVCARGM